MSQLAASDSSWVRTKTLEGQVTKPTDKVSGTVWAVGSQTQVAYARSQGDEHTGAGMRPRTKNVTKNALKCKVRKAHSNNISPVVTCTGLPQTVTLLRCGEKPAPIWPSCDVRNAYCAACSAVRRLSGSPGATGAPVASFSIGRVANFSKPYWEGTAFASALSAARAVIRAWLSVCHSAAS